jgi:8-oxo-dGTP pyrophosphatase MutT (NUDIX family)
VTRFPVSVKGVVLDGERVVLLRNEREEWELPGGKLEVGEDPERCVEREIYEELGIVVRTGPLLDAWVFEVIPGAHVLVLTYGCFVEDFSGIAVSEEHSEVGLFGPGEIGEIPLPAGYARSVEAWADHPERV